MKILLKIILPKSLRLNIRSFQKYVVYKFRREYIRIPIFFNIPIKIIIGAAMTSQSGWYSTNEQWLNVADSEDWDKIFHGKSIIKNVLAEHVFEHLSEYELVKSINLIYCHLLPGGRVRIAVPDGYNPDPVYIQNVGIAGIGADAADHKQLLNYDSLNVVLKNAGFKVEIVEGYCSRGKLIQLPVLDSFGRVIRSRGNVKNMENISGWDFVDANTSLIVDGIKII